MACVGVQQSIEWTLVSYWPEREGLRQDKSRNVRRGWGGVNVNNFIMLASRCAVCFFRAQCMYERDRLLRLGKPHIAGVWP